MIIEIVDTDYYSTNNDHVVMESPGKLKELYQEWKKEPNPSKFRWRFAEWLIAEGYAKWPEEDQFDSFEESYQ